MNHSNIPGKMHRASYWSYLLILLRGGVELPLVQLHLLPNDLPQDLLVGATLLEEGSPSRKAR